MMELPNETRLYKITAGFASQKGIPVFFSAKPLIQTEKAAYLYGHGTLESQKVGACARCGRELTHPGSIILGIGPECLKNWGLRDQVLEGLTEQEIKEIRQYIQHNFPVDCWVPKSVIKSGYPIESTEEVQVPEDHKMLNKKEKQAPAREAFLVKGQKSGKDMIKITFPFNYEDLSNVKTLPSRRFHKEGKFWTCPLSIEAVSSLREWGFKIDQAILDWERSLTGNVEEIKQVDIDLPEGLYEFQKKGIQFLQQKNGRGLIADEMGLGKTIQALGYLYANPDKRPAVVICPAAVKMNWAREAAKWVKDTQVIVCSGKNPKANEALTFFYNSTTKVNNKNDRLYIINYDILESWTDFFKAVDLKVLITDECHYYKNNKAKRTKAVKKLAKQAEHFIALSGTPIVNRPVEFFNALSSIESGLFPSFWKYAQKYCGAKHNGFGWDFGGATNTEELHETLVNTIMLRRKKADVLKELPAKQRAIVPLEIANRKEYNKVEQDFINWVRETKGKEAAKKASNAEVLGQIEALKQVTIKGKMKAAIDWIKDFIDIDGKLVVFCTHKATIDSLMEQFSDIAVKVDGSTQDKQAAVDAFQDDENVRLFVGNIKAAGTGITLTTASNVVFLELPWTPGDLEQAADRCHRIGQEADAITIWHLLAQNTIEEEIVQMLDKKRKVLDQVLDGKQPEEESLLTELIKKYTE